MNTLTGERAPLTDGPWVLTFAPNEHGVLEKLGGKQSCWAQSKLQYAVVEQDGKLQVATDRGKPSQQITPLQVFQDTHVVRTVKIGLVAVDMAHFPHSVHGAQYWWPRD